MSTSPLSNKKFLTAWLISWAVWCVFHAWIINIAGYGWDIAFGDSIVSNVILAILSLAVSNNLRYYRPGKSRYAYLLAWCFAITVVWLVASVSILHFVISGNNAYINFLNSSIALRFGAGVLITGCIAMLSWMWYNLQEQQEYEQRRAEALKLARDAELYKLRQQFNPHFIFNSLNSVSALAGSSPEKARHMIQQLSDFLRGSLGKEEDVFIPLEEELKHLNLYLEIEKVRFGHRLNSMVDVQEEAKNLMIPALILQPLVENAIKFGLYGTTDDVEITISAHKENNELIIQITNPFEEDTSLSMKGTGFGLSATRRRLFLLYGSAAALQSSKEENKFITTLKLPAKA